MALYFIFTLLLPCIFYIQWAMSFMSSCRKYPKLKLNCIPNDINFADLFSDSLEEVIEPRDLVVKGRIPSYVNGFMIRNGPAVFGAIDNERDVENVKAKRRYSHVFDGLARLTRYEIKNNKVTFLAKFLKSDWYKKIVERKEDIPPSITTGLVMPKFSLFESIFSAVSGDFDNVPVNIHSFGNSSGPFCATTDAPILINFDPLTLNTIGRVRFDDSIFPLGVLELFSTAHPHKRNTSTYNYVLARNLVPKILSSIKSSNIAHIIKTDGNFKRTIVGSIELPFEDIPYVHDFSLTNNYAVLCIWPISITLDKMIENNGFLSQMKYNKTDKTRIYVFDIRKFQNVNEMEETYMNKIASTLPIASFEAPTLFAYHHINAYESYDSQNSEDFEIIFDVTGYESADIINGEHGFAYIDNVIDPERRKLQVRDGTCYRFKLPMSLRNRNAASVPIMFEQLDAIHIDTDNIVKYTSELVRINEKYRFSNYRYSYGFTGFAGSPKENCGSYGEWGLVKQDHIISQRNSKIASEKKETCAWLWREKYCYPTEPIFIPNPNAITEDDGILISQTYDALKRETFLLFVNATTMHEVARCYTGIRCPVSFHGDFIDSNY